MSQTIESVVSAKNGSITAVAGSGIRHMSDSLIAFQPAIEEPSNIVPSENMSSSTMLLSKVTCCHLPRGSVKRRSTYFTSLSFIIFSTSFAVVMGRVSLVDEIPRDTRPRLDGVDSGFAGSDPDRFLDVRDEYLAVPDPAGLGSASDRLNGFFDHVVAENNFDLHLGEKIHDVFGTAIQFGMPLLAAEALGLGDSNALQPNFLKGFLHLVEFQLLYDRFKLFHYAFCLPTPLANRAFAGVASRFSRVHAKPARAPEMLISERVTRVGCPLANQPGGWSV